MKHLHRILLLMLICTLLLTGCWDQRLFEQTGLLLAIGLEDGPNDNLLITFTYPVVDALEKNSVDVMSQEVSLLRASRLEARQKSAKVIEAGKVQEILVSESLAKKGIHDVLEVYQRDATSPAIAYIVVVDGSPQELLIKGSTFKSKPRIGYYMQQLLENNAKASTIPNTKVFDFDIDFFAPGLDPITPTMRLAGDELQLTGCALFSDDKMVGRLDSNETKMLIGMMGQAKNSDFIVANKKLSTDNPDKYGISLVLRKPKVKYTFDFDESGIPIINISMKYECVLTEYKWNKTDMAKEQAALEGIISSDMEGLCNVVMKKLQEANSDPIGLGDKIRAKYYDYWNSIDWKEIYPQADIKVNVSTEIVKEGIIR